MRCLLPALCLALTTLSASGVASAHVTAEPAFVTSGERQTLAIEAPNEREAAMSGLAVTVPPELSIVETTQAEGWEDEVSDRTASWSGGALPAGATATFSLVVEASGEPGEVILDARQLYPGAAQVEWAVPVTVLPGAEPSGSSAPVLLIAGIGLVLALGLATLFLRRSRSLQER